VIPVISISPRQARRIALQAQHLLRPDAFGKGKQAVLQTIQQLGYIQIDTISVVQRAHLHILRSRVSNFKQEMLDELQSEDRSIFEYWSHAAAYLPMEDYRYSLPRKEAMKSVKNQWFRRDPKVMDLVLRRIQAEGPLQSKDFATPPGLKAGPWWDWKPTKKALEILFQQGELMIATRKGFQKVYDLPERVLPPETDTSYPSESEMARHLILRTLKAHAFASSTEIVYLRKGLRKTVEKVLQQMHEAGEIVSVQIHKHNHGPYFAFSHTLEQADIRLGKRRVFLLSPFDNAVIQRKRLENLFAFQYQIECYVPAPKRQYGYYSLPILFGDQFVGRLDPKADRKSRKLLIRKLWLEPGFREKDALLRPLAKALHQLAEANACKEVGIEWCSDPAWGERLRRELCSKSIKKKLKIENRFCSLEV
jgi:uncharacterized protein YcaQ